MAAEPEIGVLEAIHSTRAIRRFRPDPIPEDVLWTILDAAIRGPTGANRQHWGWIVVREPEAKRRIAVWFRREFDDTYGRVDESALTATGRIQSGAYTVSEEIDHGLDARNYRAVKHLAHHLAEAPAIVFPAMYGGPGSRRAGRNPRRAGASIYGAVQNLLLAARALGLGAAPTTLGLTDKPAAREALGLPAAVEPYVIVPVGWPLGRFGPVTRLPVAETVRFDRW